jgi:hypothetical protein
MKVACTEEASRSLQSAISPWASAASVTPAD